MVFSSYKKLRIVFFHRKGLKAPAIRKRLLEEGMVASRQGIHDFDVLANDENVLANDENVLANGDNVLENGVCEQLSKNLLIRCKLEASAYTTVRIAYSLLKRPCDCNGITKNVKFILTTTVGSLGHSCSGTTENGGWTVAFGLTAACQTGSGIMEQLAWHDSTLSRMAWRGLDSRLEQVSPIVMMDPFPNWSILEYLMVSCSS